MQCEKCGTTMSCVDQRSTLREYSCSCGHTMKTIEVDQFAINRAQSAQFLAEREAAMLRKELQDMAKTRTPQLRVVVENSAPANTPLPVAHRDALGMSPKRQL
jgi:hypothetical protein